MHYLLEGVYKRLTEGRDPGDTHDFSSSGYSGFDDGYITAVYDTLEAVEQLIEQNKLQWAGEL